MKSTSISPGRRTAFRAGTVIIGIGLALFSSFFIAVAMGISGHRTVESHMGAVIAATFVGFAMIVVGGILRGVGKAGLAGSGLTLDPDRARRDLEPWSRTAGGVLSDTLDEAGIDLKRDKGTSPDLLFDDQLRRLDALRRDGLITEDEFAASRQKVLNTIGH
jgi:hypothetical protein